MTDGPERWRLKHPCEGCGTGYGLCAQGLLLNPSLMCCKSCNHPGRWKPNPYTAEEVREMTKGRLRA